jgi:hypothetical protein
VATDRGAPLDRPHAVAIAARAVVACLISAGLCAVVWFAYPGQDELDVSTDIIGNPIFANFNPGTYRVHYLLIAVAFPALAVAIFWGLDRLARRLRRAALPPLALPSREAAAEDVAPERAADSIALGYARTAVVGALLGATIAIGVDAGTNWLATILLPVTAAYVVLARGLASLIPVEARGDAANPALSAINAVFGSLAVLALAVAAESAHVVEQDTGTSVDYPFVAPWLLGVLGGAIVIGIATWISRVEPGRWRRAEGLVLLSLVAPVVVFLFVADMPDELGPPDLFHEGERLTGRALVVGGDFPWRDVLFSHGLFSDVTLPDLNMVSLEDSRWGLTAGASVVERPLFWIFTLLLSVYLFHRNWLFLVTSQVLLILGWFASADNTRMMLVPLCLLALAALLARSTWPRAAALMAVTLFVGITVPEAIVLVAPIWAVVVAYEAVHRRAPQESGSAWSRTTRCGVAGAALGGAFILYLVANDALGGFVDYYRTFVGGHELTGAFPITGAGFEFWAWVVIPVVVILSAWIYSAFAVFSRRWFTRADWVVGAAVIGLIAYYGKFLARADVGHLAQVAAVAVIPGLYLLYRIVQFADERARRTGLRPLAYRPATVALALAALVLAPLPALDVAETLPTRLVGSVQRAPADPKLGYANDAALPDGLIRKTQRIVDAYGGEVYDFTNSPALFGYLVDADPATRFYHVSMAIREKTQRMVIDELEEERPPLVAFSSRQNGLFSWDGIVNPVRHYLISDYLLDNYRPAARVDDYVFMVRNDVPLDPATSAHESPNDLLFEGQTCDWGFAPEFLDQRPASGADSVEIPIEPVQPGSVLAAGGWAADPAAGRPAREVLVASGEDIVGRIPTGVARIDVSGQYGNSGLTRSGFSVGRMVIPQGVDSSKPLRFFAASESGVASEVGDPGPEAEPIEVLRGPDGERFRVEPGALAGALDFVDAATQQRMRLDLPADASEYTWLELSSDEPFPEDFYTLFDEGSGFARAIAFRTLGDRSNSVLIRVGSCPQWRGFDEGPLYLGVSAGAPLEARLIR